ncbi:hypothetical protein JT358_00795 [Micrococcales bacterium 31B]|nr:hypothetical protein [Micrococcales bacterium 31B]
MKRELAAGSALLRNVRWPRLAVDAATTAITGTLVALLLLLVSQIFVDSIAFEAGLNYSSRTAAATADRPEGPTQAAGPSAALTITSWGGLNVVNARATGEPAADLTHAAQPVTWTYPDSASANFASLASGTLAAGRVAPDAVLLDEASAAAIGVSVGESVTLIGTGTTPAQRCTVTVSGLTRPYHDVDNGFATGLIALRQGLCPRVVEASPNPDPHAVAFEVSQAAQQAQLTQPAQPPQSHAQRVWHTVLAATAPQVSGLLLPVMAVGLGLWLLVYARMAWRLRHDLNDPALLLFDLGCPRQTLRSAFFALLAAVVLLMSALSAWTARAALSVFAHFYTQPLQVWLVGLVFGISCLLTSARLARRVRFPAAPLFKPSPAPRSRARRKAPVPS